MRLIPKTRHACTCAGIEAMEQRVMFSVPPTADAGGPYVVEAGVPFRLEGVASDSDGTVISYQWDLDYDGVTFDAHTAGQTARYTLDGVSPERTVALLVRDNSGDETIVTTTLEVIEPIPGLSMELAPAELVGQNVPSILTVKGYAGSRVRIDMGNGVVRKYDVTTPFLRMYMDPVYTRPGTYTVTATVTDGNGEKTTVSETVEVAWAMTKHSSYLSAMGDIYIGNDDGGPLRIGGNNRDERIVVRRVEAGRFKVIVDGQSAGIFRSDGPILIDARGGNDEVIVGTRVSRSAVISGGRGNDTLHGGSGGDAINGWDGKDVIRGHGGADILMGNAGADSILGGTGSDLLAGDLVRWSNPHEGVGRWLEAWDEHGTSLRGRIERLQEVWDSAGSTMKADDTANDMLNGSDDGNWLIYPAARPGDLMVQKGDVQTNT